MIQDGGQNTAWYFNRKPRAMQSFERISFKTMYRVISFALNLKEFQWHFRIKLDNLIDCVHFILIEMPLTTKHSGECLCTNLLTRESIF